ncbi:PQQ-binding-like beta-propeller repeat protein [Haloferula sp.]|uniref:PQQ-binding-like beta-propeller repeat protein n=1 Tax=Haloferula sp. TaxID=2497595 RepID=UPI00329CA28C
MTAGISRWLFCVLATGQALVADDVVVEEWPHFLGPHMNATTRETPLLEKWPEKGLEVVWEKERGEGYACPVISNGRLFYFHRLDRKETVECREPKTGELVWSFAYPVEYQDRYGFSSGPRSSVVADGDRVYVAGVTPQLHCLSADKGELLWKKDLAKEYEVPQYFFGYGPTPVVHGNRLIINVGGKVSPEAGGVCVAAFDKMTGKALWEVEDTWGASYASPVVAKIRGKACALVLAAGESKPTHGGLLTIDAETGEVYDRFPWRAKKYESVLASSALIIDDTRVFISECYELGGVLLEFDESRKSKPLWKQREFGMHFMMPIEKDGYLYGFAGRNPPDTEFKCVDLKTGEVMWTKDYRWKREDGQIEGLFRASLLQAGERYFALGEDGLFTELELSPEGSKELQRTRFFTAREAWTMPSLHDGLLYAVQNTVDGQSGKKRRLICYDLRPEALRSEAERLEPTQ